MVATSEVAEDTEAESTDTDVGKAKYLSERVHGAERSTRHAMWPRKGRAKSMGIIGNEVRRMTMPNKGSQREESETWIWRIGCRQRLGEHRRVWFMWRGWPCLKWKTKSGKRRGC